MSHRNRTCRVRLLACLLILTGLLSACTTSMIVTTISEDVSHLTRSTGQAICLHPTVAPPGTVRTVGNAPDLQKNLAREYADVLNTVLKQTLAPVQSGPDCANAGLHVHPTIIEINESCPFSCAVTFTVLMRTSKTPNATARLSEFWIATGRSDLGLFDQPVGIIRYRRSKEVAVTNAVEDLYAKIQELGY